MFWAIGVFVAIFFYYIPMLILEGFRKAGVKIHLGRGFYIGCIIFIILGTMIRNIE